MKWNVTIMYNYYSRFVFISRLANAFSYFGIVLMTTELFESGDSCHGE